MPHLIKHIRLILVTSLCFATGIVVAQDATPEATASGTVVCDSDLTLSLTTAEAFFGFDQIMGMVKNPNPTMMADIATFNRGQYSAAYTASNNAPPIISMTQEQMQSIADMMTLDATAMQSAMSSMIPAGNNTSGLTTLNPATVADEDPTCTTLRAELNRFYLILNFQRWQNTSKLTATPLPASSSGNTDPAGNGVGGNGSGGASSNVNIPPTSTIPVITSTPGS